MATTSVTTVGGVMIITQVIPKDDGSIQLQTAGGPPAQAPPPAPPPPAKTPPPASKKSSKAAMFLRGEQQGLGVVQILVGFMCVLFALIAVFSPPLIVYAPFGLGIIFVVSGSAAVAAGRRSSTRLVCVSMWSNVLSVLLGLVGVAYLCLLFIQTSPYDLICNYLKQDLPPTTTPGPTTTTTTDYYYSPRWWDDRPIRRYRTPPPDRPACPDMLFRINEVLYGLQGLFLVLLVLQVCVSVTVCVLSGKILKRRKNYSPMAVETDCSSLLPPGSPEVSDQDRSGSETP